MSVASQFFGSGGGGGGIYHQLILDTSQTFVAPVKGRYLLTAIGGGSSGQTPSFANTRGGSAGGFCQKMVSLDAGQSLTLTIGAGGAGYGNLAQYGNNGGATTITGTGIQMTAGGGVAGNAGSIRAIGGTASGGDINRQGGDGCNTYYQTTYNSNPSYTFAHSGGGAVDIWGFGGDHQGTSASCMQGAGTGSTSTTFSQSAYKESLRLTHTAWFIDNGSVTTGLLIPAISINRILAPMYTSNFNGYYSKNFIGCGGGGAYGSSYQLSAGLFAGGQTLPEATGYGYVGSDGGMGGGGGAIYFGYNGYGSSSSGGTGGVIIEYFLS